MSFEGVIERLDPKGTALPKFLESKARHINYEYRRANASPPNLFRRWETGYLSLQEMWSVVRTIDREELQSHDAKVRLFYPFFDNKARTQLRNFICWSSTTSTTFQLGAVLDRESEKTVPKGESWRELTISLLSSMLTSASSNADEAILEACKRRGQRGLANFYTLARAPEHSDPQSPAIVLSDSPFEREITSIGINRVSFDPRIQAYRMVINLREARGNKPSDPKPLVGLSWLLTERTMQLLDRLDLLKGSDVKFYQFDKISDEVRNEAEVSSLVNAGLDAITLSPNNLRRFLITGEVPSVGVIRIPPDTFYRTNS